MVACKQCLTTNSIDSAFCKHCGAKLDKDLIQEAKSSFARMVSQGFLQFNENRLDEAMAIAEEAVQADPNSAEAVSLKGMCHEKLGQLGEALDCYERVLDLNPDSALDRVKVNQLRGVLSGKATEAHEPNQKLALITSAAAVFLMLAIGSIYAIVSHRASSDNSNLVASRTTDASMTHFTSENAVNTNASANVAPQGTPSNPQPQGSSPAIAPASAETSPASKPAAQSGIGLLPVPESARQPVNAPLDPFPNPQIEPVPDKTLGTITLKNGDPDPSPKPVAPAAQPAPAAQDDPVDDSVIEINVSQPRKAVGGSEQAADTNSVQALYRTASAQFQLKRYDSAAKIYGRLLKAGGDPGTINERLAQCYENMGRKDDAVDAYQKAIAALQSNISSGKGNTSRLRTALDVCTQAVKVLQGS